MKIESISSAYGVGVSEPLVVCMWRTDTTRAAIANLESIAAHVGRGRPDSIAFLTIVEADASMPDADVREALAGMFRRLSGSVLCSALVFEGQGFRAATVRGITTGVNLVARQPFPHKVFANVDEAAGWMAKQSDRRISLGGAIDGVRTIRSALDAEG